jgi:hypothetical protein
MTTCPKCKAPLDDDQTICRECSTIQGTRSRLWFLVVFFILLVVLLSAIFPVEITSAKLSASMAAVGTRGKDIYVGITGDNVLRKAMNLPPIWPKTYLSTTNIPGDISSRVFKTSTEYFAALYDEEHFGTEKWNPWGQGFDYSKLAGVGVPEKKRKGKLLAKNNMWLIAANVTDEDADVIPLLITRNADVKEIERIINQGGSTSNLNTRIALGSGEYKTPFGEKGFVVVRKGGGIFNCRGRYSTLNILFGNQELPKRDPSKPPIVYLMP